MPVVVTSSCIEKLGNLRRYSKYEGVVLKKKIFKVSSLNYRDQPTNNHGPEKYLAPSRMYDSASERCEPSFSFLGHLLSRMALVR